MPRRLSRSSRAGRRSSATSMCWRTRPDEPKVSVMFSVPHSRPRGLAHDRAGHGASAPAPAGSIPSSSPPGINAGGRHGADPPGPLRPSGAARRSRQSRTGRRGYKRLGKPALPRARGRRSTSSKHSPRTGPRSSRGMSSSMRGARISPTQRPSRCGAGPAISPGSTVCATAARRSSCRRRSPFSSRCTSESRYCDIHFPPMPEEITCLIVDDHEVVREGLRLSLSRAPHIRVDRRGLRRCRPRSRSPSAGSPTS